VLKWGVSFEPERRYRAGHQEIGALADAVTVGGELGGDRVAEIADTGRSVTMSAVLLPKLFFLYPDARGIRPLVSKIGDADVIGGTDDSGPRPVSLCLSPTSRVALVKAQPVRISTHSTTSTRRSIGFISASPSGRAVALHALAGVRRHLAQLLAERLAVVAVRGEVVAALAEYGVPLAPQWIVVRRLRDAGLELEESGEPAVVVAMARRMPHSSMRNSATASKRASEPGSLSSTITSATRPLSCSARANASAKHAMGLKPFR